MLTKCLARLAFIIIVLFGSSGLWAQDTAVLKFPVFYEQVVKNHPIAKQANLLTESAKAELKIARGAFDPVLSGDIQQKFTDGKNSYTYFEPQLKVPTLIGIDLKAGYDQSDGIAVTSDKAKIIENSDGTYQQQIGQYGMLYGGVSIPLLRGLQTDVRRVALKQASYLKGLNDAERIKAINKLFLSASKDYWEWQLSYKRLQLLQTNYNLALNRYNFVKSRIKGGEDKPVDSVEAFIELRRREALLVEADVDFKNTSLALSNYLWNDKEEPIQLKSNVVPSNEGLEIKLISNDSLQRLVQYAESFHPEILKLQFKNKQLQFDKRLAIENIKPQLNVEYYPFQTYTYGNQNDVNNVFGRQYKFGASFYSSLLLRKERGKLQQATIKIKSNEFETQVVKREIVNELLSSYNNFINLEKLLSIQESLVYNTLLLRNAEENRFENGESSLFLMNTRERSLIEAQIKLAEINTKYAKAKVQLQWSSGVKLF